MKKIITLLLLIVCACDANAQIITTIAGGGTSLGDGGPAIDGELYQPYSTASDASGNLYIADAGHNRIRLVNTAGIITTIAGTGVAGYNGDNIAATAAELKGPTGVAVDAAGNVYIADNYNNRIRKINATGIITTVAGNGSIGYSGDGAAATAAELDLPHELAVTPSGIIYIADTWNNCVRKVDAAGIITTIAGNGSYGYNGDNMPATAALLSRPYGLTVDASNNVYVADQGNFRIRKIENTGDIITIAGNAGSGYNGDNQPATAAILNDVFSVAVDGFGNVYLADEANFRIRMVNTAGIIITIAGIGVDSCTDEGQEAILAKLLAPLFVSLDASGDIYITDFGCGKIEYIRSTVGIKNVPESNEKVSIYPNPCTNDFTMNIAAGIVDQAEVSITNNIGQKVQEFSMATNRPKDIQINEPAGLYIINVRTATQVWSGKVLVHK